jgi:hypothetical protein
VFAGQIRMDGAGGGIGAALLAVYRSDRHPQRVDLPPDRGYRRCGVVRLERKRLPDRSGDYWRDHRRRRQGLLFLVRIGD